MTSLARSLLLVVLCAHCSPVGEEDTSAQGGARAANGGGDDLYADVPPDDGFLVNEWQKLNVTSDITVWETGVVYDPLTARFVQQGGHVFGRYAQSSYTNSFDPLGLGFERSKAPVRPQRRCLVQLAYIDSLGQTMTAFGGTSHGSLPQGGPAADGKSIITKDGWGPWLYDGRADTWEDTRVLGGSLRIPHRQIAYDPNTDSVFAISGTSLSIYSVFSNRWQTRAIPEALTQRAGYGISVDPTTRKLVVFGGTGPETWTSAADPAAAYGAFVRNDTWVYEIESDRWHEVSGEAPPRGEPVSDFLSLQLRAHAQSGTLILIHTPADVPLLDRRTWPSTAVWSFDPVTESWSAVETKNPPPLPGNVAYDSARDIFYQFGGGRDAAVPNNVRPAISREVFAVRVRVPGHGQKRTTYVPLTVQPQAGALSLQWPADGSAYRLLRAPTDTAFVPLAYVEIAKDVSGGSYVDSTVEAGKAYAYQLVDAGGRPRSLPAWNVPRRPGGLRSVVKGPREVALTWSTAANARYNVYRGNANGGGTVRLTPEPVSTGSYTDTGADLGDGIIRMYWVRAVGMNGLESGPSPVVYSVTDAPPRFEVEQSGPDTLTVRWDAAAAPAIRIWHNDHHENTIDYTQAEYDAWWKQWVQLTPNALTGGQAVVKVPASSAAKPHHYLYGRGVNALGQLGFYTDIASPTDEAFASSMR